MNIAILYGTETGNAQFLAEDMADQLANQHETTAINMEDVSIAMLREPQLVLIFTSTYGDGELPASAKSFYHDLTTSHPDLNGVRFAVFGLGDRTYADTFGSGARQFDSLFAELGAERAVVHEVHDALDSETLESHASRWISGALAKAKELCA